MLFSGVEAKPVILSHNNPRLELNLAPSEKLPECISQQSFLYRHGPPRAAAGVHPVIGFAEPAAFVALHEDCNVN